MSELTCFICNKTFTRKNTLEFHKKYYKNCSQIINNTNLNNVKEENISQMEKEIEDLKKELDEKDFLIDKLKFIKNQFEDEKVKVSSLQEEILLLKNQIKSLKENSNFINDADVKTITSIQPFYENEIKNLFEKLTIHDIKNSVYSLTEFFYHYLLKDKIIIKEQSDTGKILKNIILLYKDEKKIEVKDENGTKLFTKILKEGKEKIIKLTKEYYYYFRIQISLQNRNNYYYSKLEELSNFLKIYETKLTLNDSPQFEPFREKFTFKIKEMNSYFKPEKLMKFNLYYINQLNKNQNIQKIHELIENRERTLLLLEKYYQFLENKVSETDKWDDCEEYLNNIITGLKRINEMNENKEVLIELYNSDLFMNNYKMAVYTLEKYKKELKEIIKDEDIDYLISLKFR
jgi:hypothetical protein